MTLTSVQFQGLSDDLIIEILCKCQKLDIIFTGRKEFRIFTQNKNYIIRKIVNSFNFIFTGQSNLLFLIKKIKFNTWSIHGAIDNNCLNDLKFLNKNGLEADLDHTLMRAIDHGHLDIIVYLIERGTNVTQINEDRLTQAVRNGNLDVVMYLLKKYTKPFNIDRLLEIAICWGYLKVVEYLHSQGADIDQVDDDGDAPLHQAAKHGHLDIIEYLLGQGANIDQVNGDGDTPLHCAVYSENLSR